MKTTIDIADALIERAKAVASREDTTLRALVEQGLRRVLSDHETAMPFELPDASFGGEGLQSGLHGAAWERIRDLAYGDRA